MRSLLGNWERLRDQLDDAITDGIQAAVAGAQQRGERDAQIILEYFSLTSMEVRDFVERQRSILLDADLIERMRRGLSVVTEAESATQSEFLELRIEFLSDARTQGIEMAWNAFLWRVARWFAVHDTQPHGTGREE